jgi:hypothetical protein
MRHACKIVLRKSAGKKPLERARHRGEDIMKVNAQMK